MRVITDRSNESRDDYKSKNLNKDANGCRPPLSAETAIIDVENDDIDNNAFLIRVAECMLVAW
jgi:hypothetical protein